MSGGGRGKGGEGTHLLSTAAADGDEDAALLAVGLGGVDVQVGAADRADLDLAVDDEREADRVLPAAEEALRAVDRVERPHACAFGQSEST